MGSGKGKARRVPTSLGAKLRASVEFVPEKWEEFVESSEMRGTSLTHYYCGENKNFQQLSMDDHQKVTTEIFNDAVAVGAIVLPEPFVAEDFEFRGMATQVKGAEEIGVALKAAPELLEEVCSYTWAYDVELSDQYVTKVLGWIAETVGILIGHR